MSTDAERLAHESEAMLKERIADLEIVIVALLRAAGYRESLDPTVLSKLNVALAISRVGKRARELGGS